MVVRPVTSVDLPYLVYLADLEHDAIGFIPMACYERIVTERLPNATLLLAEENTDPVGFLYATHRNGFTKVQQVAIQSDARRLQRASVLVEAATRLNDAVVSLRCADDLEATCFWEALGFQLQSKVAGGKRRKRVINYYSKMVGGLYGNPPPERGALSLAGSQGVEPRLPESKSGVFPLDYEPLV